MKSFPVRQKATSWGCLPFWLVSTDWPHLLLCTHCEDVLVRLVGTGLGILKGNFLPWGGEASGEPLEVRRLVGPACTTLEGLGGGFSPSSTWLPLSSFASDDIFNYKERKRGRNTQFNIQRTFCIFRGEKAKIWGCMTIRFNTASKRIIYAQTHNLQHCYSLIFGHIKLLLEKHNIPPVWRIIPEK